MVSIKSNAGRMSAITAFWRLDGLNLGMTSKPDVPLTTCHTNSRLGFVSDKKRKHFVRFLHPDVVFENV